MPGRKPRASDARLTPQSSPVTQWAVPLRLVPLEVLAHGTEQDRQVSAASEPTLSWGGRETTARKHVLKVLSGDGERYPEEKAR